MCAIGLEGMPDAFRQRYHPVGKVLHAGGEVGSSELTPARQRVPLQALRFGRKRVLTNYCILDVQSQNFADHLAVVHSRLACT